MKYLVRSITNRTTRFKHYCTFTNPWIQIQTKHMLTLRVLYQMLKNENLKAPKTNPSLSKSSENFVTPNQKHPYLPTKIINRWFS